MHVTHTIEIQQNSGNKYINHLW